MLDLCKASIYSSVDQSLVASFLTIRNKAAHGEYSEYDADQEKPFDFSQRVYSPKIRRSFDLLEAHGKITSVCSQQY